MDDASSPTEQAAATGTATQLATRPGCILGPMVVAVRAPVDGVLRALAGPPESDAPTETLPKEAIE